jgi:L-alanine-DL-glutamate epimerase-like enolase superfamily enzyme
MRIIRTEILVLGDPRPPTVVDDWIDARAFLRIYSDEGLTGLSELFWVPAGVARAALHGPESVFGRLLCGAELTTPAQLRARMWHSLLHASRRGWAIMCLGAAEVALWDLYGKWLGQPVYTLLGGSERSSYQLIGDADQRTVLPYCTVAPFDWDKAGRSPDQVCDEILGKVAALHNAGYRAFKIEPLRLPAATIIDVTRRTRDLLGPEPLLSVDVGCLWNDVATALRVTNAIDPFDVLFLETPFPTDALNAYARLAPQSPIPLAAGEHSVTRWEFRDLLDRAGVSVVQPYVTTCGGFLEALSILDLAQERGALVCPGNWGTDILAMATLHLAAVSPLTPCMEYVPALHYWSPLRRALAEHAAQTTAGHFSLPTTPGIGIDLSDELIARFTVSA